MAIAALCLRKRLVQKNYKEKKAIYMKTSNEEKWPDMRMKHLEMLQNVISRMASNSASMKNYTMSISAAIIALSAAIKKPEILYYSIPLIAIFCILDAQYLRLERAFRDQYNSIRKEGFDKEPDFSISPSWKVVNELWPIVRSWSVWLFYVPIIVVFIIIGNLIE